jgi:hypothetical protein
MLTCDAPAADHREGCFCCAPTRPLLWSIYAAMHAADPAEAVRAIKEDPGEDERPEDDPFLAEELLLAALLATAFLRLSAILVERLLAALETEFSPEAVARAIERAGSARLPAMLTPSVRNEAERILERGIANGVLDSELPPSVAVADRLNRRLPRDAQPPTRGRLTAPMIAVGTVLSGNPDLVRAWESLNRGIAYYSEQYVPELLLPRLGVTLTNLAQAVARGGPAPNPTALRTLVTDQMSNPNYWRLLANVAVSRGYHAGILRAGEERGVQMYRWQTVQDGARCTRCARMHGKTFRIDQARALLERAAEATNPDAVKEMLPWPTDEDMRGLSTEELAARGIMVPPLHAYCRCSLVLVTRGTSRA